MITKETLSGLCSAANTLCGFCGATECEKCIINNLINDAYDECNENEDEF